MPPFDQSAMDGYALNSGGEQRMEYVVVAEIKAGDDASEVVLNAGEAARIFTGAMVPDSATTVAKQEITIRDGKSLTLSEACADGMNIRKCGEQYQPGDIIVSADTTLTAGTIGLIATNGIEEIEVYSKPKIHLITTGSELIKAGSNLTPGKIYESNSVMLKTAFQQFGFDVTETYVNDNQKATEKIIEEQLEQNDLLILSGGISVGDYDFVKESLESCGVKEIFYKVKQKPGKPLYFGQSDNCTVFALPGNPASALTCYYMYVLVALQHMTGRKQPFLTRRQLSLSHDHHKKGTFTNFLKAYATEDDVSVHSSQSSAMLSAFSTSNAILEIPAEINDCFEGEKYWVSYIL